MTEPRPGVTLPTPETPDQDEPDEDEDELDDDAQNDDEEEVVEVPSTDPRGPIDEPAGDPTS